MISLNVKLLFCCFELIRWQFEDLPLFSKVLAQIFSEFALSQGKA